MGGNFRFATKVTKDAPKGGKTTVRSGFLSSLWNPCYLSTDRASPPSLKRRGLTDMIVQRISRGVGACNSNIPTSREPPLRTRKRETPHACRAEAVRDSVEGWEVFKGGRETAPNGFLPSFDALLPTFTAQ